jgi:PH domain
MRASTAAAAAVAALQDPLQKLEEEEEALRREERELRGRTVRAGWLWKQGHNFKTWKRRWFVLRGSELSYFSKAEEAVSRGTVDLLDFYLVPSEVPKPGVSMRLCNKRIAGTELDYLIYAETVEDFVHWVRSIALVHRDFEDFESKKLELAARREQLQESLQRRAAMQAALEEQRRIENEVKQAKAAKRLRKLQRTNASSSTRSMRSLARTAPSPSPAGKEPQ